MGKLAVFGPVLAEGNNLGMAIFDASSVEEAQSYAAADPMVEAGFLTAEIYPWIGLPGDTLP